MHDGSTYVWQACTDTILMRPKRKDTKSCFSLFPASIQIPTSTPHSHTVNLLVFTKLAVFYEKRIEKSTKEVAYQDSLMRHSCGLVHSQI